jgi:lipopolysaccharide biosynthesis glycosyltransferase
MSDKTLAIYAAADDAYVPKAVMALRSFQRWHPGSGYFLLGTQAKMSQDSMQFIRRYNIELIDVDESRRFVKLEHYKYSYPLETVVKLKGPELLAERGFPYSLVIDGDVYCVRPLKLEGLLERIEGYAGRIVGDLARTLVNKQSEQNKEFDFNPELVRQTLGIDQAALSMNYEVNGGVLFWNNMYMARIGLFDRVADVFRQCQGCFEGGQDLMTFTAAAYNIPFMELGDPYNFNFFEDSHMVSTELQELQKRIWRGQFHDICIVHFIWCKPWLDPYKPSLAKKHFINAWRKFILDELGDTAYRFFDDLSIIRPESFAKRLWSRVRRIGGRVKRCIWE